MIVKGHTRSELAGNHLGEGDLSEESVCQCLKDECHGASVLICVSLGNYVDDLLKNVLDSLSGKSGAGEYRTDVSLLDSLGQSEVELLVGELAGIEVDLHELFVNFSDGFGNRILVVEGNYGSSELGLKVSYYLIHVDVVLIYLVDYEKPGSVVLLAGKPGFLSSNLDSGRSIHQNCGCLSCSQSALDFTGEIEESRGVKEVDLDLVEFHRHESGVDGISLLDLRLVIVGYRRSVLDLAESGDDACRQKRGIDESGLAASAVAEQSNVSDGLFVIAFHICFPPEILYVAVVCRPTHT